MTWLLGDHGFGRACCCSWGGRDRPALRQSRLAATLAGPLGIVLAVNCRAAEHHLGNWWLAELGAALALAGLAAVGLAQRLRR